MHGWKSRVKVAWYHETLLLVNCQTIPELLSKVILHLWVQGSHFLNFFRNKLRILNEYLKSYIWCQNSFFKKSHLSKIFIWWNIFSKFSNCSKMFFVRKLNDGSLQYCEVCLSIFNVHRLRNKISKLFYHISSSPIRNKWEVNFKSPHCLI